MKPSGPPVTIAFARRHCTGIQVHCNCGRMTVIGFERFGDEEIVPELVNHHRFTCSRCGRPAIATRPNYPRAAGTI